MSVENGTPGTSKKAKGLFHNEAAPFSFTLLNLVIYANPTNCSLSTVSRTILPSLANQPRAA